MPRPGLEERLAAIQNFNQLKAMLRDDLGWPVQDMSIDDLTFEYEPEELGLKKEDAAKVEEIRQLRSIDGEPFGIFFIRFQRKHMPVTVMRRLLQQLSVRKRKSANPSDRQVWERHDLLFVSQWGEDARRHLSFVHFRDPDEEEQLPSIRVLGWDADDTDLKMEAVARQLEQNLAWRRPREDEEAWRQRWSKAFHRRHREVIESSKTLSRELAGFARRTRSNILSLLKAETDRGPLRTLMRTFRDALIHDLDEDGFADMYAQTVAYGMLAAWLTGRSGGGTHVPVTTPFLRDLLTSFMHGGEEGGVRIDFDELGLDDIEGLFADSNREAILEDFGDRKPEEDPVIHFYEDFLHEYDPKEKKSRGVFYTPRPVVSFIVRSVDEMLRAEFGLEDGLADTATWAEMAERIDDLEIPEGVEPSQGFVRILDPATGTGTFLVEVIELVHRTMTEKWRSEGLLDLQIDQHWNAYVDEHLLPRLFGYELMMAPYAIAHLKIGLTLLATGYEFKGDGRVQVYLTNALEPAEADDGDWHLWSTALADESKAVNAVKRDERFTVVIGNPPYSDASHNLGTQYEYLINDFRYFDEEKIRERGAIRFEHVINNDYVKFWGLCLATLRRSQFAVVCMISSNSFVEGKSFRGVRDSMHSNSLGIRITNLHGKGWSSSQARLSAHDENVFDITTGVAVARLVRPAAARSTCCVEYGEVVGSYSEKCMALSAEPSQIEYQEVEVQKRNYLSFVPAIGPRHPEYWSWCQLDDLFTDATDGIKTSRDGLVVGNTRNECGYKVRQFASVSGDCLEDFCKEYRFGLGKLNVQSVQQELNETFNEKRIYPFLYRPFDRRYIYYEKELILSHRMRLMTRILHDECMAIVCASRLSEKGFMHAVGANTLCSNKYASHDINSRMFPFVLCGSESDGRVLESNISPEVLGKAGVPFGDDLLRATQLGNYVLAILNSRCYQERYREEIQQDFPRIPFPLSWDFGSKVADLGAELMLAHCLNVVIPNDRFKFMGCHSDEATTPKYRDGRLWIGRESYIDGVQAAVWEFRLAGYQIAKSWFSAGNKSALSRKSEPLSSDVVLQYRSVLQSVSETIRIMGEIDEVIDAHGGWPDAFVTEPLADADTSDEEVSA